MYGIVRAGMNVPLIVAGSLALLASAIHGVAGDVLVVRKLPPATLPTTPFGDTRMTKTMIHVCWHMTTIALVTLGAALVLSGSVLDGDTAQGIGLAAAGVCTAFWLLAMGLAGVHTRSARFVFLHPAPILFTLMAALAWWGAALL